MSDERPAGLDGTLNTMPPEVYSEDADFVTVAMKRLTAERVAGSLRDAADVYDMGGASKSAEHMRAVADRLEAEVSVDE